MLGYPVLHLQAVVGRCLIVKITAFVLAFYFPSALAYSVRLVSLHTPSLVLLLYWLLRSFLNQKPGTIDCQNEL